MSRQLCIMACAFCRDPLFHSWMESMSPADPGHAWNEASAKAFILSLCEASSRNELDTDPAAGKRFHLFVRAPFVAWKESRP